MNFKVPLGGHYKVTSEVVTYEPTNEFEEVLNPNYRWWKFWLPKTVSRKKYRKVVHQTGEKVVYLRPGEVVYSEKAIVRIGG